MNRSIKTLTYWVRGRLTATASGEDGVVTAVTVIVLAALIVLAGLVFDGGMAMKGRVQALDEAQEAARAGAQQIDIPTFRSTGQAVLNTGSALGAAEAYLAATGDAGTVSVSGETVAVTVTHVQRTQVLALIGIGSFTEKATATATAEQGG